MTKIEWTQRPLTRGETWNPTTGCNKVSQGCKHCYAEVMHRRLQAMRVPGYEHDFLSGARPQYHALSRPLKWKQPRTVFVNSMSDLFHVDVPFDFIDQVFAVMAQCPQHTFIILTKRPERMAEYIRGLVDMPSETKERLLGKRSEPRHFHYQRFHSTVLNYRNGIPMPNVWLGTSVEHQKAADERIPHLLKCPAAVRFLSCEPLLGPVSLRRKASSDNEIIQATLMNRLDEYSRSVERGIDWVIAGGESGHGARPMHPDWVRSLRDQCQSAGVPFFFKQWGAWHVEGTAHSIWESADVGKLIPCRDMGGSLSQRGCAHTDATYYQAVYSTSNAYHMRKVGKHASGRLLDGVEHNAFPA